jgi:hypothetical protein
VPLSWNLRTVTSWDPLGHSRPVTGLLLLFILEAVPPSATWGSAMPWWQEPTYHGRIRNTITICKARSLTVRHQTTEFRVISENNRNKKDLSAYDYAKGSEFDVALSKTFSFSWAILRDFFKPFQFSLKSTKVEKQFKWRLSHAFLLICVTTALSNTHTKQWRALRQPLHHLTLEKERTYLLPSHSTAFYFIPSVLCSIKTLL